MEKFLKLRFLSVLTLIIPINILVIGDYLGAGIQFPLIKYQVTYLGSFFVTIFRDLNYIMMGVYTSNTAYSVFVWFLGVLFLILGVILMWIISYDNAKSAKTAGVLIIISAVFFLISTILQYGLFFNGPAGIAIPIGFPVLFVIGWWIYHDGFKDHDAEIEDEESGE
jgi:hypothetical protein